MPTSGELELSGVFSSTVRIGRLQVRRVAFAEKIAKRPLLVAETTTFTHLSNWRDDSDAKA
jgi:hypothetical protein